MALTDNLVSYWKLDESSGNAADSVSSNTLTNSGVTYTTGKINNGAVFNNTADALSISDASQSGLDITGDLSWFGWVKHASLPSGIGNGYFSKDDAAPNRGYSFYLFDDTGTLKLFWDVSLLGTLNSSKNVNWTPSTGVWYHIGIVYDSVAGEGKFYVDGSQQGSTQTGYVNGINNNGIDFVLGKHRAEFIDGMLDEVGIWNRTLSGAEITSLYNGGTGIQYPFTVTYTISVSDALTITESVTITNSTLGGVSVVDVFTITESVTVEFVNISSVSDALTITESVTVFLPFFGVNIFDTLTVTENLSEFNPPVISVFDALTITESITIESFRFSPDIPGKNVGTLIQSV